MQSDPDPELDLKFEAGSDPKTPDSWKGLYGFLILLATMWVYFSAINGGFIWDDEDLIVKNPLIQDSHGLRHFWFGAKTPDYFPMSSTFWWLEWRLWKNQPAGYHFANILLHAFNSVLIWRVLRLLKVRGACLVGLIFAVHPVNVETVAWVSEGKNTLSMCFYLLTFLCYFRFEEERRRIWYGLALLAFSCSLLSKTSGVVLPIVLLGCAWWQRGKIRWRDAMRAVPFFILAVAFGLVTLWFHSHLAIAGAVIRDDGWMSRSLVAGRAVWFYASKILIPSKLCFVYPRWPLNSPSLASAIPLVALFACLAVFFWKRKSWGRPFLFGTGYFVVCLLPVLGFVNVSFMQYSLVADHWQYMAMIGVIAMLVGIGIRVAERLGSHGFLLMQMLALFWIVLLGAMASHYSLAFQDRKALAQDILSKDPSSWVAYYELASLSRDRGQFQQAARRYSEALRLNPNFREAHYEFGNFLWEQGKIEEAKHHFQEALRIHPADVYAHNDLGNLLASQGKFETAMEHFYSILRLMPDVARTHFQLGDCLLMQGKIESAVRHYRKAVILWPDRSEPLERLAWVHATTSDVRFRNPEKAILLGERACGLTAYNQPWDLDTLATAYAAAGHFDKAVATASKALRLAQSSGPQFLIDGISQRLKLYQQGRIFCGNGAKNQI